MDDRSRFGVGILALALAAVVSCGGRALDHDAGTGNLTGTAGAGRGAGVAGQDGGPATGGQSGAVGPSGSAGSGGAGGRGGAGGIIGSAGIFGTGGRGGVGGAGGRGGLGGTGGTFSPTGSGGFAGRGGSGGSGGTGGSGGSSMGGFGGTGGAAGRGGTTGGFGGELGTGGRGGSGGVIGSGGTGGIAGRGGTGGVGGTGGTGGLGGVGGTGGGVCLTCRSTLLPIMGRDVVYNAARKELYVSVAGDADLYPNTIVVVDPITSSVTSTIPVGSNPGKLALSDDGSTLWVGIDGAHAIRKVTLTTTTPTLGPLVRLTKPNQSGYYDALTMTVLPGAPLSVVVVMSAGQYQYVSEVRVYDDGVQRPVGVTAQYTASALAPGPPGIVYGALSSPAYFFVYNITPSGITQSTYFSVFRDYARSLFYSAGRVYAGSGDVVDVTTPAQPTRVAGLGYSGVIAAGNAQSPLLLTSSANTFPFTLKADVRVFSTSSLAQTADVQLQNSLAPLSTTSYASLVYAGSDTVAFLRSEPSQYVPRWHLAIVHDPAFGTPTGGTGGIGGGGGVGGMGTGGAGGMGGTGGAPDPCPGCTFTNLAAYGTHFVRDAGRNLLYVSSGAGSVLHPSTIVTVDTTAAAVTSFVPVGNDPQPLALSDDGTVLWVGLAGERRVRRMTPGPTPAPGAAYALPTLLTTGEQATPYAIAVLPGTPGSIAVSVFGTTGYGAQGVFILDDGMLRANYVQPPEISSAFLINGPPGYLLAVGGVENLLVYHLGTVGATVESYPGLVATSQTGFAYSGGFAYASQGEVVDLTNPDMPLPAGRFAFANCMLAVRSASRVMMLCPDTNGTGQGPTLRVLDTGNYVPVGSVTMPVTLGSYGWSDFAYLGGDAIALIGYGLPLEIVHAPIIGSPP